MSDLITNFAAGVPRNTFSQIGALAATKMQERRAMLLQQQQEAAYQDALSTFMGNQTPENRMAVLQAGRAMGKFEEAEKTSAAYETSQRVAEAQQLAQVLGPLYARNYEMAANNMDSIAEAYSNSGDQESAQEWKMFSQAVREGRGEEVAAVLAIQGSFTEEGTRVVDNVHAMGEDRRARTATEMDLVRTANNLEWDSPEAKAASLQYAEGKGFDDAVHAINLSNGIASLGDDGLDANGRFNAYMKVKQDYDDQIRPHLEVTRNADMIRALANSKSGFADQGMITALNKIFDPGSVVRQAEYANTVESIGGFQQAMNTWAELRGEGKLPDGDAIQNLLDVVDRIENITKMYVADEQESIGRIMDVSGLKREVILANVEDRAELELNAIKFAIIQEYPQMRKVIMESTLEELREHGPYKAIIDNIGNLTITQTPPATGGGGGGTTGTPVVPPDADTYEVFELPGG